jgi:hypothetical protein
MIPSRKHSEPTTAGQGSWLCWWGGLCWVVSEPGRSSLRCELCKLLGKVGKNRSQGPFFCRELQGYRSRAQFLIQGFGLVLGMPRRYPSWLATVQNRGTAFWELGWSREWLQSTGRLWEPDAAELTYFRAEEVSTLCSKGWQNCLLSASA